MIVHKVITYEVILDYFKDGEYYLFTFTKS